MASFISRMVKYLGALAGLLAVTGGCGGGASSSPPPDVAPQPEPFAPHPDPSSPLEPREDLLGAYSGKVYRVEELLQAQLQPGTYVVDAYAISIYLCEPCPPDAECEQCLNDHVVLADRPEPLEGHGRGRSDLLILEPPADEEPGAPEMIGQRRYRLRIHLRDPSAAPAHESVPTKGWIDAFAPLGD
jgi:hypothetical protein